MASTSSAPAIPGSKLPAARKRAAGVVLSLLMLAQLNGAPGYNLGIPTVPGTRTPESNPGTTVTTPGFSGGGSVNAPGGTDTGGPATATPGSAAGAPSGPGYSFGAAPPPVVAPGR